MKWCGDNCVFHYGSPNTLNCCVTRNMTSLGPRGHYLIYPFDTEMRHLEYSRNPYLGVHMHPRNEARTISGEYKVRCLWDAVYKTG